MSNYVFSDSARAVLHYLRDNQPLNATYRTVAEATGLRPRSASCTITALAKKNLVYREEVDENTKYIHLTNKGMLVDIDAVKSEAEKPVCNE